jgi:hypothetical protein
MPTTQARQIRSQLSTHRLQFNPTEGPARLSVTVYNDSDRFAAFCLSLKAPGVSDERAMDWYRLVPSVSSKIPSGDTTQFEVEIFALPPTESSFTGVMSLKTIVSSIDLDREDDRQDLELRIEGSLVQAPRLELQSPNQITVNPGDPIQLVVDIENRNRQILSTTITLSDEHAGWFEENGRRALVLGDHARQTVTFQGTVPTLEANPQAAQSQIHALVITATQSHLADVNVQTDVQILPVGEAIFSAEPIEAQIPEKSYRWLNPTEATATYTLTLDNQSNVPLVGQVTIYDPQVKRWQWPWEGYQLPWQRNRAELEAVDEADDHETDDETDDASLMDSASLELAQDVEILPSQAVIPIANQIPFTLEVTRRLPWCGWARRQQLEAHATLLAGDRPIQDGIQTLELLILPVIPFWLQLSSGLSSALLIFIMTRLFPSGHTAPVNAVQFNGQGTQVMSAANDQTIRRWSVEGDQLISKGVVLKESKAVRALQFRPVNNDEIAAGLENGEIRIANLLVRNQLKSASLDNADRVFALAFSRDSRQLFSAHGSGQVIAWEVNNQASPTLEIANKFQLKNPFAISALALLGEQEEWIAVGGRFNRLNLINQTTQKYIELPYPTGGQEDYIKSLTTAQQQPQLLASSDNKGKITVWNLSTCQKSLQTCEPIGDWTGHGGRAVNTVKLTQDGCFLASGGSDGQVNLWALDTSGRLRGLNRNRQPGEAKVIAHNRSPINSIDVIRNQDKLLILTGSDDHQVRLHSVGLKVPDRTFANQCSAELQ